MGENLTALNLGGLVQQVARIASINPPALISETSGKGKKNGRVGQRGKRSACPVIILKAYVVQEQADLGLEWLLQGT